MKQITYMYKSSHTISNQSRRDTHEKEALRIYRMVLVLVSVFAMPASAEENITNGTEYITFRESNPDARIDEDGFFEFAVNNVLYSAVPFGVSSSSVTIVVTTYNNSGDSFKVTLEKDEGIWQKTKTFYATGRAQSQTYTGLDTNARYWLVISNDSDEQVSGYGHISNYVDLY